MVVEVDLLDVIGELSDIPSVEENSPKLTEDGSVDCGIDVSGKSVDVDDIGSDCMF